MLRGAQDQQKCARSRICAFRSHSCGLGKVFFENRPPSLGPPARLSRESVRVHKRAKFVQRTRVYAPLEIDHFINGPPERHPANAIEFGLVRSDRIAPGSSLARSLSMNQRCFCPIHSGWLCRRMNLSGRRSATSHWSRRALRRRPLEANFFVQFTKHCIDRLLAFSIPPCGNCQPLAPTRPPSISLLSVFARMMPTLARNPSASIQSLPIATVLKL